MLHGLIRGKHLADKQQLRVADKLNERTIDTFYVLSVNMHALQGDFKRTTDEERCVID